MSLYIPLYTQEQCKKDLFNALQSRPNGGLYSGRALGNTENIKLWTPQKLQSFYNGIKTAHNIFYSNIPLLHFARLVICECCQESTGDYNLGVRPTIDFEDHTSAGIIQVTPGSVLKDYYDYGMPIVDCKGHLVLSPSLIRNVDLRDPGICIIIWAWYTYNSIAANMSLNEYAHKSEWNIPEAGVTRDYGNCTFCWLAGPHNDRFKNYEGYKDYHLRMMDYAVQSAFFTKEQYESLLATPTSDKLRGVYASVKEKNRINNRNTVLGLDLIEMN